MYSKVFLFVMASLLGAFSASAAATPVVEFDFTKSDAIGEWKAAHDIGALTATPQGMEVNITGDDPYCHGPARSYPSNTPLWAIIRLKSDEGGQGQIFYSPGSNYTEERSIHFTAPVGEWATLEIAMPTMGDKYYLRLDPPGTVGKTVIANLRFEPRVTFSMPQWAWTKTVADKKSTLVSGPLEIAAAPSHPFGFEVRVNGMRMGCGYPTPRIGYVLDGKAQWLELSPKSTRVSQTARALTLTVLATDAQGSIWDYRQTLRPEKNGSIAIETSVKTSQDREVIFIPMPMLVAGADSFGATKNQAVFAGLEYLENEPSSSNADIEGLESRRQVPAPHKLTFPLMAVQASGRYLGLVWDNPLQFATLFDSPDRIFNTGGHVMGVLYPGWNRTGRVDGDVLPTRGALLKANTTILSHAWIIGGTGDTIIPAVQHYVRLKGLPPLPKSGYDAAAYARLAAEGWLHSKCREGNLYRHAVWPGFNAGQAADAALFEDLLAARVNNDALANELRAASKQALSIINPSQLYHSGIGHIRTPAAPLVYGHMRESFEQSRNLVTQSQPRFAKDGSITYHATPGKLDYGRTHYAPDANGLTAQVVSTMLEAAAFNGDPKLIRQALERLRGLSKYRGGVPRGAQTWEMPLHTPDILASAYLINAYVTGYELTGDTEFLREANYWAWTGVPFIYLTPPTDKPVGTYSTIAVLGATSWQAPIWFGQPVQWCGLVYAAALQRLAPRDRTGPWKQLADGITITGIQFTWKNNDTNRVGLLPDFYHLREQRSDGPAINPATVGVNALALYGLPPLYEFRMLHPAGIGIHAPGGIEIKSANKSGGKFVVRGWPTEPYQVLLNGLTRKPELKIDGKLAPLSAPHDYDEAGGRLILSVDRTVEIEIW